MHKVAYKVSTKTVIDRLEGQIKFCKGHIESITTELEKIPAKESHIVIPQLFLEVYGLMDIEKQEVLPEQVKDPS